MLAFERARRLGAAAIEFDVHFSQDGVPVVLHDPDLRRIHGREGVVRELKSTSLAEVRPAIPRLRDVLGLKGLHFMIEIKTKLTDAEAQILARELEGLAPGRDYHLLALDPSLAHVTAALPARAWILVGYPNVGALIEYSLAHGLGGVSGHYLFMSAARIARLHAAGQVAGAGFIPNLNLLNREWARGVDWVFTNNLPALTSGRA